MRRLLFVLVLIASAAGAQVSLDVAGGVGSVVGTFEVATGGFWPAVSATLMFNRHLGINADFTGRGATAPYGFSTNVYRPYLTDVNVAFRPGQFRWQPEVDLGWAGESTSPNYGCAPGIINGVPTPCPQPPNIFNSGAHLGLSVTAYLPGGVFFRPVYHLYFGTYMDHPNYLGLMVGYTFGGH